MVSLIVDLAEYLQQSSHDTINHYLSGEKLTSRLSWDNVESLYRVNHRFRVLGKGNKQRWCFYSDDLAEVLENYLRLYRHFGCPALFTAQHPFTIEVTRLSYRTAHKDWSQSVQLCPELEGFRLDDLRHTFATERVGLMGIEELRALMGHTNIQTTLLYQKVTSSRAEEVAKKALLALTKSKI